MTRSHPIYLFIALALAACAPGCSPEPSTLVPPHTVADDTSLAPKDGRRIQLNSQDEALTANDCRALIDAYRSKAGSEGQVSVHKPSKKLQGIDAPPVSVAGRFRVRG